MSATVSQVRDLLTGTDGKIASVTFRKRSTGEVTTRRVRTGVKRGVQGVGQSYNPADHDLITIFDMDRDNGPNKPRGRHLNIPLDAILEVKCGDLHYLGKEDESPTADSAPASTS